VTSYWGYVTFDGVPKANAQVIVLDSSGNPVASNMSLSDAAYTVKVLWDDLGTPGDEGVVNGETITFKMEGQTSTSRIIDPKGSSIRLDLNTSSTHRSSGGGSIGGGGGGGASGENYTNIEGAKTVSMAEPTVSTTLSGTPEITATVTPVPTKKAPGFGIVLGLIGLMAIILRKRSY